MVRVVDFVSLWVRILPENLDTSLWNISGSTQVTARAWNNARRGTWGLPQSVKLERCCITFVSGKSQPKIITFPDDLIPFQRAKYMVNITPIRHRHSDHFTPPMSPIPFDFWASRTLKLEEHNFKNNIACSFILNHKLYRTAFAYLPGSPLGDSVVNVNAGNVSSIEATRDDNVSLY